jgi:hypothetical protein
MNKILFTGIFCFLATALQAQDVLKVQSGVILSSTGGVTITLNDMDFDNDGIFEQGVGQGILFFKGMAANRISGNSSTLFDLLQLDKTGSGTLTLHQGIRISSGITFNSGNLDLNAQNILLSPFALLNGESENSHITSINGGYVQIINTLTSPSAANPGNLGIEITTAMDLGSVIIRRGHESQKNAFGNGKTILRYYDIIPDKNSGLNARLRINYLDAELNNLNENELTQWTSSDNQNWTSLGFTLRNAMSNFVQQEGINNFSRFTLTESNNPLPLVWGSLHLQCIAGQAKLSWKTLQEQNTAFFIIRRSSNGGTWTNIGSIPAAGNSQSTLSYSYTDSQSLSGTNYYYQVMQQDLDGSQTFSPVLTGGCAQAESIKVYPIPAQNNCRVSIQSERNHSLTMHLYNAQGALLKQQNVRVLAGYNVYELSMADYPRGIYSLVLTWNNGKVKVIKVEKI